MTLILLATANPALAARVYVTNEKGNDVTVLDSETLEVIGTYPVGNRPRGITISPDMYMWMMNHTIISSVNKTALHKCL